MGAFDGLAPEFASRLQALIAASGGRLRPGSGLRSVEEQARLRIANGCPDVWTSPASSCRIPTAIPGRSNHNHGLAMDLAGPDGKTLRRDRHPEAFAWLQENMARFGLHLAVPGEDWHVEMIDDDKSRGFVQAAQQGGAIGFDANWLESPMSPEEKQDQLVASYMGVITGAQREALLGTPSDPALETPQAPEVASPELNPEEAAPVSGELRTETTMLPGQAGGAPAAGDKLSNAQIIAQVGRSMGANDQQIKIALAAGLVESGLQNVDYGDRDSLGLFQQRPSQGWGTPQQVLDPQYAARQFFSRLLKLDPGNYSSPGLMAQAVQRSAYPHRYDERWGEANAIFNQLGGG